MAENQNDQTDIEPLDDAALEEVAGGSTGSCCSCANCSNIKPSSPEPTIDEPILIA